MSSSACRMRAHTPRDLLADGQRYGLDYRMPGLSLQTDAPVMREEGRVHGWIGHNGSGESTLLKLLAFGRYPWKGLLGRLVALHGGRVLAEGAPDVSMMDATLEAIHGLPMQVMPHPSGDHVLAVVA